MTAPRKTKLPSMKVKRTPRPKRERLEVFKMTVGTPTQASLFSDDYATLAEARAAGRKIFAYWIPWCERYNQAGIKPLETAMARVDSFTGDEFAPYVVEAPFDEYTGMVARVTLWREEAHAPTQANRG